MSENTARVPKANRPGLMSSLLVTKGAATPAPDAAGATGDKHAATVSEAPSVAATAEVAPAPVPALPATPSHALPTAADLEGLIASMNAATASQEPTHQAPKSTINAKLAPAYEQKLKRIVGFEKARRMSNFSQQDWLESRLTMLIDLEYSKLPQF